MKKYFLFVFCAVLLFGVVGCSKKNQVVCSKTTTEEDISVTEEGVYELDKDNKVTSASGTLTFSDKDTAESYCSMFQADPESAKYVSCSGKKITIKNLEEFASDEEDEADKIVGLTKDELVKALTEDGYSCK